MKTDKIIEALEAERQRISEAIAALNGSDRGKHTAKTNGGGRYLSADARKRISMAQKKRWAAWAESKRKTSDS